MTAKSEEGVRKQLVFIAYFLACMIEFKTEQYNIWIQIFSYLQGVMWTIKKKPKFFEIFEENYIKYIE